MSGRTLIEIETRTLSRLSGDLIVAGFFSDDRPLRGGAALIDWRLCGLLSELIRCGQLGGVAGEAVLMPSAGSLRCPRILLLGLGPRARFQTSHAQHAMRDACARAIALAVRRVVISPLGISSDDFPRHAPAVVTGLLEALQAEPSELQVGLTLPAAEAERAFHALEAAIRAHCADALVLRRPARAPDRSPLAPRGSYANP